MVMMGAVVYDQCREILQQKKKDIFMQIFFKPTHTVDSLISTQTLSLSWMILKVNFSAQRETENKVSSHRAGVKRAPVFSLSALSSQLSAPTAEVFILQQRSGHRDPLGCELCSENKWATRSERRALIWINTLLPCHSRECGRAY